MSYIRGNFKRYIYKSDNAYVVGLFKIKDASDDLKSFNGQTVTFTGYFTDLNESDLYIFHGKFIEHERYGNQFQTDTYEMVLPNDKDKIIEFLSSNLFPKIGEKKATKIVDVLGNDTLNTILNDKESLLLVPTVTRNQADIIYDNLVKYQYSFEVIVKLTQLGFNPKDALQIYNYYRDETLDVINCNPYSIIDYIGEVTFKKIDKLRSNFAIEEYDLNRLEAAIKYVMEEVNFSFGSTYLTLNEIIMYTKKALFLNNEGSIFNALNNLLVDGEVIKENEMYFLSKMYNAEHTISDFLYRQTKNSLEYNVKDDSIAKLEDYFSIVYNDDQKKAIKQAMKNNVMVITGGPGTGKTTIIKAICKLYQDINGLTVDALTHELVLLAPTGRASKRIAEQTNLPASTIHRFLKWQKESNTFLINEDNKSDVKFIIVDETSMLDTYLFYNLILGINITTKIILIGDSNQLPSVGPGQVLKDIIDSDIIPTINLKHLYRQEESSPINLLAHSINNNEVNMELFDISDDLLFVPSTGDNLKEKLKEYVLKYKDNDFNEFQVMAPIYKGDNGIDELNYFLQNLINKKSVSKTEIIHDGVIFREKDKVLELVNMPDENIYNGDIGKILKINKTGTKDMLVDFDNIVRFTPNNYSNLKLGYAISIHKSQGSEFDIVIIPILNVYNNMLYKKLIYTGITRAKKKLVLIGEETAFIRAVSNNKEQMRNTNLKNILLSCIK